LAVRAAPRRLFGLAPAGGYPATTVTSGAVGSYPTVSPLPGYRANPRPGRFLFCGPIRRLAAPRRYLAAYPVELGLSSDTLRHPRPSCPTSGCNIAGRPGCGEVTGSKWLNSPCVPDPRQSPLRLLPKWKQCRIGSLPLCQHLTILLPGFSSAAQPLVGGTPEQPDPAQHAPA